MATATLTGGFTYVAFTVTGISPAAGPGAGGTTVTLTGTHLDSVLNAVTFGGVSATDVTVISDTEITCVTPAGTSIVDVVISQGSESVTLDSAFEYTAIRPSIILITPSVGPQDGGTDITITGSNFDASSTVSIGGNPCTSVVVVDDTEITCTTPAGTLGSKDVTVTNIYGSYTVTNGFTYYTGGLVLTGLSVIASLEAGGAEVSAYGINFDGSTVISINGIQLDNHAYEDSTLITGNIPAGTAGVVSVTATKGSEVYQLTDYFTYVANIDVISISPSSGVPSGGDSITITGANFVSGAIATIGGIPLVSPTVASSTVITGTTPQNTTGLKDVVVSQYTAVGVISDSIVNGFEYGTEGDLGPDPIKDSFDQLLYVAGGITSDTKPVQDAGGNYSPINVSTDSVEITQPVTVSRKLII